MSEWASRPSKMFRNPRRNTARRSILQRPSPYISSHPTLRVPSHSNQAAATCPQPAHLLPSSFAFQPSMTGLSCVPRSTHWKRSSRMMVGVGCAVWFGQYHRSASGSEAIGEVSESARGVMGRIRNAELTLLAFGTGALNYEPNRVGESARVVGDVG